MTSRKQPASRHSPALFLRQHADNLRVAFEKEKGGKQRLFALFALMDKLGNRKNLDRLPVRISQRGVRSAEVDSNNFFGIRTQPSV